MINILLADNDSDFLEARAEYLESVGYYVFKVSTYEETKRLLQEADLYRIHLAILDIRLINDDDEKDESGLRIALDFARTLPKIILTNFPSRITLRNALKAGKDGLSAAVDYLDKAEGPEAMVKAIEDTIIKIPPSNTEFRWREPAYGFGLLAYLIEPNKFENFLNRTNALEDLIRLLFRTYGHITFGRILWKKDERIALEAFCYSSTRTDQFVLVCGSLISIKKDEENYQKFAPQTFKNNVLNLAFKEQNNHYAALAWELLPSIDLEKLQTLTTYYQEKNEKNIRQAINNLFNKTLVGWYAQGCPGKNRKTNRHNITSELSTSALQQSLISLGQEARNQGVLRDFETTTNQAYFDFPGHWRVPLPPISDFINMRVPTPDNYPAIISPGNLDPETILIDPSGQSWITDFSGAGCAPAWQDYAKLELAIRFLLLNKDDLRGAYEFEKKDFPLRPFGKSTKLLTSDIELRKAGCAIQEIRLCASKVIGYDPSPYYFGLLELTLIELQSRTTGIHHTKRELVTFLYGWIFAGEVLDLITQAQETNTVDSSMKDELKIISIEEASETVMLGDRELVLSPIEYKLILLLYRNRSRVVKTEEIIKHFFPNSKDLGRQTSWITTTIFRIRDELGDNRYVRNVRKKGYQLVVNPSSETNNQ